MGKFIDLIGINFWRARIQFNKTEYHIGVYETFEEATTARVNKEIELGTKT